MKQISAQAYQALRDALPVTTWNKRVFESFLRDALRAHPELLVGLDFTGVTKRETADTLIDRLAADEGTYQATTSSKPAGAPSQSGEETWTSSKAR